MDFDILMKMSLAYLGGIFRWLVSMSEHKLSTNLDLVGLNMCFFFILDQA